MSVTMSVRTPGSCSVVIYHVNVSSILFGNDLIPYFFKLLSDRLGLILVDLAAEGVKRYFLSHRVIVT